MQGFNMGRYIPPSAVDANPTATLNNNNSAPRSRKRQKQPPGTTPSLTVRFEMPFPIWCAHCPRPTLIPQGVRFNAEKRRAGAYHTTPIWSFTLKHTACGGAIEVRTDPKNAEYVVVSGARRRDYGDTKDDGESLVKGGGAGGLVITTERERQEQRESAFGKLERTIADREQLLGAQRRIGDLLDVGERQWEDPYKLNQRLRRAFRAGRHVREREAARAEEVRERMGLGIELLPETEEDARRAGLVDFGGVGDGDDGVDGNVDKALARPLFDTEATREGERGDEGTPSKGGKKLKSEIAAAQTRKNLVSEIVSNTRAAKDPFLDFGSRESTPKGPVRLPGLKRKRVAEDEPDPPPSDAKGNKPNAKQEDTPVEVAGTTGLVGYDSDSD